MSNPKYIHAPIRVSFGKVANPMLPHSEDINKSKGWVKWGKRNDYPQWLLKLYYNNALHSGIINSKVDYIVSGGYTIESDSEEEKIKAEQFLESASGELSFKDVYRQNAFDLCLFNSMDMRIVFGRMSDGVKLIEPINGDLLRQNSNSSLFFYSKDWSTDSQDDKTGFKTYFPYNPKKRRGECILHYQEESRSTDHKKDLGVYPKPSYSGGLRPICTDSNIDDFNYYELVNGFKSGTIINLANGVPETEDERNRLADEMREGATDMDNANGIIVAFSDGKETAAEVISLNGNDLPDRYNQSELSTQQKILTSHSAVSPGLHGIKTAGQLGGTQELEDAFEIFKRVFVSSKHETMQSFYNRLLQIAGINATIILNEPLPLFQSFEEEDGNDTLKKLTSLPVDIRQTILADMRPEDRLLLAGITTPPSEQEFSKKDPIALAFSEFGRHAESVTRISEVELFNFESKSLESSAHEALSVQRFNISGLSDWEEDVLAQLLDNVELSDIEGEGNIKQALKVLREKGYLDSSNKVTPVAREIANISFEILYEYVERSDAPPLKPGGESRGFCREMLALNKIFTREEIDRISIQVRRDVWLYRGGWYHNPNTDRNTPSCRHTWRQVLVQNGNN